MTVMMVVMIGFTILAMATVFARCTPPAPSGLGSSQRPPQQSAVASSATAATRTAGAAEAGGGPWSRPAR